MKYTLHFKLAGKRRQKIKCESITSAKAFLQTLLNGGVELEGPWLVKHNRETVACG